jgi:hypothetical protein
LTKTKIQNDIIVLVFVLSYNSSLWSETKQSAFGIETVGIDKFFRQVFFLLQQTHPCKNEPYFVGYDDVIKNFCFYCVVFAPFFTQDLEQQSNWNFKFIFMHLLKKCLLVTSMFFKPTTIL